MAGGTGRIVNVEDGSWFTSMCDVPLGRIAEPADVIGPVLFLAGSGSAYMTGQVLHLSGGRLTP
jgi:NAD(P)-dependent dehydrogenase (short-subunit alcohol dehydrogenase family)